MTTFKEMGLRSDLMKSLEDLGFEEPTPIQAKAIPFISESREDLIALAQTGTGKTAAFGLPILNQIEPGSRDLQSIILCPTRELCIQIAQDLKNFAKYEKGISITPVYGGERIENQIQALKRGTNIVVGTPGRVHDLIRRKVLKLHTIEWLVLDEADEMLDMGFKEDLDAILEQTPQTRQTLLFSATISRSVSNIAKNYMNDAKEISVAEKNIGADKVSHEYYVVGPRDRFEALKRILDYVPGIYGILFCRTKRETQDIADKLKRANYDTDALHGDVSQNMRTKIMDRFKKKNSGLLVATDVAARGIDVSNLSHVINYNMPEQNSSYVHRTGRTGRASKSGVAMSIVMPREVGVIHDLEKVIGQKFEQKKVPTGGDVCQKQVDNFLQEIKNTDISEISNEKHFKEFEEKLKQADKEDLVNYVISYKFSHLMEGCKNVRDLNANAQTSGSPKKEIRDAVTLKINFGKKHGFGIKGLFDLINSRKGLQGLDIGNIELMPEYTIFTVEKEYSDKVIRSLADAKFKGEKMDVSVSQEKPSYRGGSRGGGGSSYGEGKKRYGGSSRGGDRIHPGRTGRRSGSSSYKGGDRNQKRSSTPGGDRNRKSHTDSFADKRASNSSPRPDRNKRNFKRSR